MPDKPTPGALRAARELDRLALLTDSKGDVALTDNELERVAAIIERETKRAADEPCDCVKKVNEGFQENPDLKGIYLRTTTNLTTGAQKPIIAAERRIGKGRKAPPIIPSYCPFCGAPYPVVARAALKDEVTR